MQIHLNAKVFKCGLVINPSCPYLAASPDRKVIDFNEYGLLEIKCPNPQKNLSALPYLLNTGNGFYLKKTHKYYYQVIQQLAVTGCEWCDFFVYKSDECHCERIYFNQEVWDMVKEKLDFFYFFCRA